MSDDVRASREPVNEGARHGARSPKQGVGSRRRRVSGQRREGQGRRPQQRDERREGQGREQVQGERRRNERHEGRRRSTASDAQRRPERGERPRRTSSDAQRRPERDPRRKTPDEQRRGKPRARRRATATHKRALNVASVRPFIAVCVVALLVVVIVIVGVGVVRCSGGQSSSSSVAQPHSQSTQTSSTSAASSSSASTASSKWKQAAGVDELTSQGTDPTAEAAELEAERIAKNKEDGYEGVEDPWVESGYFTTGDKELDKQVKEFCDKHSTKGKSASENAYDTFCNITWSDYDEWEGNQHPETYDWTVSYAKDFFSRGGNCFSMASAIQWCLRYFGYSDAHAELTYQLRQSGDWLDHGLNWVTDIESGEIKLVDSEMAAKGWMMPAGAYSVEILDPTSDWEPRSSAFR